MSYLDRTKINVSGHIEKKGRFSYLSWVFALDELQKQDETAVWQHLDHTVYPDGSMMVTTTVTAFGKTLPMFLPVMDHNNKAIKNPDSFAINKAYMRCLAKNVAAHGIGLYIFAGEDIPNAEDTPTQAQPAQSASQPASGYKISEPQGKRLMAICKESGVKVAVVANQFGFQRVGEIEKADYKKICEWVESQNPALPDDDIPF